MKEEDRQLNRFLRQHDWIVREYGKWFARRCSPKRTRALGELSQRADQLLREYERFERSIK